MQIGKSVIVAALSASAGCTSVQPRQNQISGYLDLAATTIVIYESEVAYRLKDKGQCISGTFYPLKRVGEAAALVGKKVTAQGYVVTEQYYLSQLGDDIAQMSAPIQNLCRNVNVITIVRLVQTAR